MLELFLPYLIGCGIGLGIASETARVLGRKHRKALEALKAAAEAQCAAADEAEKGVRAAQYAFEQQIETARADLERARDHLASVRREFVNKSCGTETTWPGQ